MPIDRRVARTQGMLHQALFALILEKGYDAISIKDICDAANVGRTTFYAHYASKDDLKRSGLAQLRRTLVERHRQPPTETEIGKARLAFSLMMFEHARDHLHLYRALIGGHGGAVALETIRETLSDLVREELPATVQDRAGIPRDIAVQFVVGGYMAMMTAWLDAGAQESPERMDAMFQGLAKLGLDDAFP